MNIKGFQIKNVEASSTLLFVAIVIELLVAGLGVFLGIVMVTEGSTQIEVPLLNRFVPAMMFFVVAVENLQGFRSLFPFTEVIHFYGEYLGVFFTSNYVHCI